MYSNIRAKSKGVALSVRTFVNKITIVFLSLCAEPAHLRVDGIAGKASLAWALARLESLCSRQDNYFVLKTFVLATTSLNSQV